MSVMLLQDLKSSPQKSRPFGSGHRRHGVWLAIGYSYKLGQKMNLNFSANYRLVFAETVTYYIHCGKRYFVFIVCCNTKEATYSTSSYSYLAIQ